MTLVRSQEEILKRIEELKETDFFRFQTSDLILFLNFENARPFLREEATVESWKAVFKPDPALLIKQYLEFAWGKATDKRGLSAGRSIDHFRAWLWLAGEDELLAFSEDEINYPMYGIPILRKISERFEFDTKEWDLGDEGFEEEDWKGES